MTNAMEQYHRKDCRQLDWLEPSTSMIHMSAFPARSDSKAICLPSGDHVGNQSANGSVAESSWAIALAGRTSAPNKTIQRSSLRARAPTAGPSPAGARVSRDLPGSARVLRLPDRCVRVRRSSCLQDITGGRRYQLHQLPIPVYLSQCFDLFTPVFYN